MRDSETRIGASQSNVRSISNKWKFGALAGLAIVSALLWLSLSAKIPTTKPSIAPPHEISESQTVTAVSLSETQSAAKATKSIASPDPDGEQKISDILGNGADPAAQSQKLLALFPALPGTGQVEASRHLVNLVSDENYAPLAEILTNSTTPAAVSEILFFDLINRPNSLKFPLLLAISRNVDHPQAEAARELLERIFDKNYGTNWEQWEVEIRTWLKQHPD